jgi:hypothetical protein
LLAEVVVMGVRDFLQLALMDDPPITASLGPIDRLILRLKSLEGSKHTLLGTFVNHIGKLKEHLEKFRKLLKDLSEMEETSYRAKWWMKEVRNLCYDTEDYMVQSGAANPSKTKLRSQLSKFIDRAEVLKKTGESFIDMEIQAAICFKKEEAEIALKKETKADMPLSRENKAEIEILPAKLVAMLAFEDDKQPQLKLVAISGLADSGKTTLARTIYVKYKKNFQCSAFVRISRDQDFRSLLTSILSQIKAPSPRVLCGVQDLIHSTSHHLQDKRYELDFSI